MNLSKFIDYSDFLSHSEIDKTKLLCYFFMKNEEALEFNMNDVKKWFLNTGLSSPNTSRLRRNIIKSKDFIRGSTNDIYKLSLVCIKNLEEKFPELNIKTEDIANNNSILPEGLYLNTRGYIENLAKQINASYEFNIFDGCAVLMRRLLEVLLIHTYEKYSIQQQIQDEKNNYFMLEKIVSDAKVNKSIGLSRNTKNSLDDYRTLGNFSAHKIHFNCRRSDIDKVLFEYRATIEELLYKSGIKK
ncbi:DUF4145 domain-containing protein [Bacillus sp. FSL M8-0266]|uniref:DUF4145 domain-containing protein n=1 Tax=Bacillus TaxID=1386 RepID=UPI0031586AE7